MAFLFENDLKNLARQKHDDASLLFSNHRYSGAYYLAGYAVELGLKASIAESFIENAIPDKKFVNDIYRHNLTQLIGLTGFSNDFSLDRKNNEILNGHWGIVTQWTTEARYRMIDAVEATAMMAAVTDQKNGIFPWIMKHW